MTADEGEVLCQNDIGEVRSCDCGGVNLAMGPMTLHLAPPDVSSLLELILEAHDYLEGSNEEEKAQPVTIRRKKTKLMGSLH